MTNEDFKHVSHSSGFTITRDDDRPSIIRGKRKWYAPWRRYPDQLGQSIIELMKR